MPRLNSLTSANLVGSRLKFGPYVDPNNVRILLVSADPQNPAWLTNVRNTMTAVTSSYSPYTFTITTLASGPTLPTVSVGQYDVIWFWSNGGVAWNSSFKTVNDAGTGLITSAFLDGVTGVPTDVLGVRVAAWDGFGRSWVWPEGNTHPISIGTGSANQSVYPFTYTGYCSDYQGELINGGSIVVIDPVTASSAGNGPNRTIVAVKDSTAPVGRTAHLNLFATSNAAGGFSDGNPQGWNYATHGVAGGRLFINACLWAARKIQNF